MFDTKRVVVYAIDMNNSEALNSLIDDITMQTIAEGNARAALHTLHSSEDFDINNERQARQSANLKADLADAQNLIHSLNLDYQEMLAKAQGH